ncbi:phospholipase D delta [Trifolium repens]|nr:phospholipase D delta [Trifolium repens]
MFCFNASFQSLASAPQCVSLSSLPSVPLLSHNHALKTNSLYRKIGRDVIVMATGDAPAETEVPEFVKTPQDAELATPGYYTSCNIHHCYIHSFLSFYSHVQTNRKRDFVYIVIPMWSKGVPSSTTMQQILFWQDEVSTTGIQLHQQMRCSSSYCHKSSRHGVGNEQ